MKYLITALIVSLAGGMPNFPAMGQTEGPWQMQQSGCKESLRGLHVLNAKNVWASGTNGTVVRTTDGGANWTVHKVEGAEELDFRDIHAFNRNTAVIISAGAPARVYRTTDAGKTWTKTFEHPSEKAFFDAMSFRDDKKGIAMSDPIDGYVLLIVTRDGGKTWDEIHTICRPRALPGEGGFAASGTNMRIVDVDEKKKRTLIALGSAKEGEQFDESRIVWTDDWPMPKSSSFTPKVDWRIAKAPLKRNQSSGIFSMCFIDPKRGVVVGGNYLEPDDKTSTGAYSIDGGKTWTAAETGPTGYRSGVAVVSSAKRNGHLVAVGTNGTDLSTDGGKTWKRISEQGFHAVQFTPGGQGWATGGDGKIAKWVGETK